MFRFFCFFTVFFLCVSSYADDCLRYKMTPRVDISQPNWIKYVTQPDESLVKYHGNVVATLTDDYDIVADITYLEDGFCVGLKSISASIGYKEFNVKIDKSNIPNTCTYNAILSHEDKHINAYLSIIDDYKNELRTAIYEAADSIMPIYVKNENDISNATDELNNELQNHPYLILVKQKMNTQQEIKNKRIDQNEDNAELEKCLKYEIYD